MELHTAHTSTPRPRNDERERLLLERVALQDRQAFEELYVGYHRRLTRFLMRIAPRYDIAEEVINDTFWIVWQKAADFRGGSQVSTWIMGIAYRRALKTLRALKPEADSHPLATETALPLEDPNDVEAVESWVRSALAYLPIEQRMALELAYYLGHSCEEIGTIMQCPVSTVKARMFHARQKLKQLLPQLAGETEEGSLRAPKT
jgi:RNA polymerase sigma-70 factor, ECF subfamily